MKDKLNNRVAVSAFNRTTLELKHDVDEVEQKVEEPFNRTTLELKLQLPSSPWSRTGGF